MSATVEDLGIQVTTTPAPPEAPAPPAPAPDAPAPETPDAAQQPEETKAPAQAVAVEEPLTREQILRPAFGALMTTLGCAFMVGGMFTGIAPRIYGAMGGTAGVVMAVWAARATKRVTLIQAMSLFGIVATGLIALGFSDPSAVGRLGEVVGEAASNARLRRPPAAFELGWRAILPWTIGMLGYASTWVGSMGRKPAVGILVPIPVIAFAAIAQPPEAQIPAGIVAFVTFALALGIIYRADRGEGEGVSTAYELKRAMRSAPLMLVLVGALVGLSQTNLLFPEPLYDPTERAQLPKAVPLSGVKDRVLFQVDAEFFTGPWRAGVLDVYDGANWRLPPYKASSFEPVPSDGLLNPGLEPKQKATITVDGLEGTVLPLPARMYGIVAEGPSLVVDDRTETVRVETGQVENGLVYRAAFALLPTEEELAEAGAPDPAVAEIYLDTANTTPPPAVKALLDQAPDGLWERLDFLRGKLLDTVTATGQGLPAAVPPAKVQDMVAGSKEGTPFEIVAAQALMARWAGVPSRIGYGFDKGEEVDGRREYRPKHGAAWLEVYFEGHGWFPVTGLPKKARATIGKSDQQIEADVLPSDDIAVQLFIPLRVTPANLLFKQAQKLLLLASPFLVTAGLVWLLWPVVYKARRRARRRAWAFAHGRAARIAVAYTDVRDMATDLGVGDPYLTPLAYVTKVVPDDEHRELAWLVTRCLWGDLRETISDDDVLAAEELARSIRRRLYEAQPFTIRAIALVSRLSLRNPYAPELMSPPLAKFSLRRALRRLVPKVRLRRAPQVTKETLDEAVEVA